MPLNFLQDLSTEDMNAPVGNYLTPVDTAFIETMTIGELLEMLPLKQIHHEVRYFYIVDDSFCLTGILSTRDLLFNDRDATLAEIALPDVVHIAYEAPLYAALHTMTKYELLSLPITDDEHHLLGIFDLGIETMRQPKETGTSRDVFQLIGLHMELSKLNSSVEEFRYRMPWLLCNLIGGLSCAAIASLFYHLLDKEVIIALFIPLVLTLGEAVSMQSMTLSLQFLRQGVIPWKRVLQRITSEWKTSALLGLASSALVIVVYLLWYPGYWPLVAIASSIFLTMMVVTTFGSLLPVILHHFRCDPKVASGPVVLMITDVTVTSIYLLLSNFILLNS